MYCGVIGSSISVAAGKPTVLISSRIWRALRNPAPDSTQYSICEAGIVMDAAGAFATLRFLCYETLDSFRKMSAMSRLDHQHSWRDYSASTPLAP